MKKYSVHVNEINYYLEKDIESESAKEAVAKYTEMFNNGDVEVSNAELLKISITEIES